MSIPKLLTVKQFCKDHPAFSEGGIRHLIFHEDKNEFHKCIRRVGRRVLIDEEAFFLWVEGLNDGVKSYKLDCKE